MLQIDLPSNTEKRKIKPDVLPLHRWVPRTRDSGDALPQ